MSTIEEEIKKIAQVKDAGPVTSEEAKAKGLIFLAETQRPELLTEIGDSEVKTLTRIEVLADIFECDLYRNVAKHFKEHRVSLHRKGRAELLTIAKGDVQEPKIGKVKRMIPFLNRSERHE